MAAGLTEINLTFKVSFPFSILKKKLINLKFHSSPKIDQVCLNYQYLPQKASMGMLEFQFLQIDQLAYRLQYFVLKLLFIELKLLAVKRVIRMYGCYLLCM